MSAGLSSFAAVVLLSVYYWLLVAVLCITSARHHIYNIIPFQSQPEDIPICLVFFKPMLCVHPHSLSSRCLQVRGRPYDSSMRYPAPTFTGFTHQHSIFTSTRMCIQTFLPSLISCHSSYIVRFSCLCGSTSRYTNPGKSLF